MLIRKLFVAIALMTYFIPSQGQSTFPYNGVKDENPRMFAFTNANIIIDPKTKMENATMLIKGNYIEQVGQNISIPVGYVEVDLKNAYIYPGFIDMFSSYGIADAKRNGGKEGPQFLSNKSGAYNWNEAVKPEIRVEEMFTVDSKKAEELRNLGFGAVNSLQKDGIFRSNSIVVALNKNTENEVIIKTNASNNFSFNKGVSTQDYPSSLMGSIALIRQTFYDANWYEKNKGKTEVNISLESINKNKDNINIFEINEMQDVSRVSKIGKEFNKNFIIKACGTEYQRISESKKSNYSFILPLKFPKAFNVEDMDEASLLNLSDMKHWELAPSNPSTFEKNKIEFAITSADLESTKDFWPSLLLAIDYGLSKEQALKSLTETPAKLLGLDSKLGTIEKGKIANFIVCSKELFDKKNTLYSNWIQGNEFVINAIAKEEVRGSYALNIEGLPELSIDIKGEALNSEMEIKLNDSTKTKSKNIGSNNLMSFYFSFSDKKKVLKNLKDEVVKGEIRLNGIVDQNSPRTISGRAEMPDGSNVAWSAVLVKAFEEEADKKDTLVYTLDTGKVIYPFSSFGNVEIPKQKNLLIKNASLWTNEDAGIIENGDLLIVDGKINRIGKNLSAENAEIIDAKGKFVSPGIIDEHSHIAISRGVNEGTQAITSEVRIGDVLDDTDVNIYRQLSGGVTTSHLLHGSANPIGGQTALIKLRWGKSPEEMKFENADGFIKFALGENVKQSNWGDRNVYRYPQTRMGVEQVFYNGFIQAKKYNEALSNFQKLSSTEKANLAEPRKDLELDALVEILNDKRFITCHSYVQSEINMLLHVADSMKFKVNTLTHILEGYKVADKMKDRNVNASTFADWWAYKFEVIDAIPYNASIMTKVGVNTCINSDDAEMARRLNQEAAKTVKYGGMSEIEAFKMVTLNPAKAMHIDNRVGSLKEGKDADIVIWNDNPLSIYAKVEKTIVDGIVYFDAKEDQLKREEIKKEKARLIQKMIEAKNKGAKTQKPSLKASKLYTCDDVDMEGNFHVE